MFEQRFFSSAGVIFLSNWLLDVSKIIKEIARDLNEWRYVLKIFMKIF